MTREQRGSLVREWSFIVNLGTAVITAMAVYYLQDLSKTTRSVAEEFREFRGIAITRIDYVERTLGEVRAEQERRAPYVYPHGVKPNDQR